MSARPQDIDSVKFCEHVVGGCAIVLNRPDGMGKKQRANDTFDRLAEKRTRNAEGAQRAEPQHLSELRVRKITFRKIHLRRACQITMKQPRAAAGTGDGPGIVFATPTCRRAMVKNGDGGVQTHDEAAPMTPPRQ